MYQILNLEATRRGIILRLTINIIFIFTLCSAPFLTQTKVFAQIAESLPPIEQDHPNAGCPLNSFCDESTGKRFLLWQELNKTDAKNIEEFRGRFGLPIKAYSLFSPSSSNQKNQLVQNTDLPGVWWDLFCDQTLKTPEKTSEHSAPVLLREGQFFVLDTKKQNLWYSSHKNKKNFLKNQEHWALPPVFYFHQNKQFSYLVPVGQLPVSISQTALYFVMEADGQYYDLKIDPQGAWSVPARPAKDKIKLLRQKCPLDILKILEKSHQQFLFFPHYQCYQVRPEKNSGFADLGTLVTFSSCSQ
jgi:hypothetical protein